MSSTQIVNVPSALPGGTDDTSEPLGGEDGALFDGELTPVPAGAELSVAEGAELPVPAGAALSDTAGASDDAPPVPATDVGELVALEPHADSNNDTAVTAVNAQA